MTTGIDKRVGAQGTKYQVRVEYPPDALTGRRRQRAKTFRTKKEAEAALAQWRAELERGTAVDGTAMTVGEYLTYWLEAAARPNLRATTYSSYEHTIRRYIVPALGHIKLEKLTAAQVQAFYGAKLAGGRLSGTPGGLSNRTVRYCHMLIRQALKQAVRWGYIANNVTDAVKPPILKTSTVQTWSPEEVNRFLNVARGSEYSPLWLVALTTGMRRGELLGLRWKDVDLERREAHIQQCVVELRGNASIQQPKTQSGQRTVTLSPACIRALRLHRERQGERRDAIGSLWHDQDLIFAARNGKPILPRHVLRSFRLLTQRAGVPPIRFHDLRHTHATLLLKEGENVKVVAERLGHADINITLKTYAHLLPSMQRRAATRIDEALFGTDTEGDES